MIELPGYSQLWGGIAFFKKSFFVDHPKEYEAKREDTKISWWYRYNIMISKHWLPAVIIVRLLAVDAVVVVEVLSLANEIFILVLLKNLTKSSFIWKRLRTLSVYIRPSFKVIAFYITPFLVLLPLICFTVCASHCKACSRMTRG